MALICLNKIVEASVNAGVLFAQDCQGNHLHITGGLQRLREALNPGVGISERTMKQILDLQGPLGPAAGDGDRAA